MIKYTFEKKLQIVNEVKTGKPVRVLSKKHNGQKYQTIDIFTMKSYQRMMLDDFMVFLKKYRTEFKLLNIAITSQKLN